MANISTIILRFLSVAGIVLIIIGGIYYPSGQETQTWPKTMAVSRVCYFYRFGSGVITLACERCSRQDRWAGHSAENNTEL